MTLTDKQVKALKATDKPVFDSRVPGLFITPTATGGKWTLRFTSPITMKRRDAGLGTYPQTSISDVRQNALTMRKMLDAGIDPIEQRKADKAASYAAAEAAASALTFEKAARQVHKELKPSWKNKKHAAQWLTTLETHAFPKFGSKRLDAVTPKDCADALRPIWNAKPETASRTRQRMDVVFKWAWAHDYVSANPVAVVDRILPKQNAKPEHQPAMPWRDVPAFVRAHLVVRLPGDSTRAALEMLILTGCRSGEIRNAEWTEFDLERKVWSIPAARMKMKELHRVALSDRAVAIIEYLKEHAQHEDLVFPAPRGKVLSDMTLTALLRRVDARSDTPGRLATAHGFRSSFRDWASENGYARDLAERALAHAVANKVEAAYHRTDLLEQRRPMMQAWADHVCSTS